MARFRERLQEAYEYRLGEVNRAGGKLSLNEVSRRAGLYPGQLSRLLSGRRGIAAVAVDQLAGLSDALQVSIDWLCGRDVPMCSETPAKKR